MLKRFGDWRDFLSTGLDDEVASLLRRHERTGRPLGWPAFVARLEKLLNRALAPRRPGRKPKAKRAVKPSWPARGRDTYDVPRYFSVQADCAGREEKRLLGRV